MRPRRSCSALQRHRLLGGEYVLCLHDGSMAPGHTIRDWLEAAQRRAGKAIAMARHSYGAPASGTVGTSCFAVGHRSHSGIFLALFSSVKPEQMRHVHACAT